jgi:hypothetical protein
VAPSAFGQYVGEKALLLTPTMQNGASHSRNGRHAETSKNCDSYSDVKRIINKTFSAENSLKKQAARSRQQNSRTVLDGMPGKPIFYTGMSSPQLDNLTTMEKKILRKLKETARGKAQVNPVKLDRAKSQVKKLYTQQRPTTKSAERRNKAWSRQIASPTNPIKTNNMKFSMGVPSPNNMAAHQQPPMHEMIVQEQPVGEQ